MASKHQKWNQNQKELRRLLEQGPPSTKTMELFFKQHAEMHTSKLGYATDWSYQDETLEGLGDAALRVIPNGFEHSIAWLLWHMARIEDVTMSMLVAGKTPIFENDHWQERLGISIDHTGNAMLEDDIRELSRTVKLEPLIAYRLAVAENTVEILKAIDPKAIPQPVDPQRMDTLTAVDVVLPEASGVLDYWSKRTVAGLLLMPATRHNMVHLNEADRMKDTLVQ